MVGVSLLVRATSSKLIHAPLVIVHLNVTLLPTVSPVTVLLYEVGVVTTAPFADPTMLHCPEPVTGALAASVKLPELHNSWSSPAKAVVGIALFVITTTSEVEQGPLLIVHLNVTLLPTGTPVMVVVGDAVFVMVAVPASMVHNPGPGAGALPARVKVDVLHNVCGPPADAVGGVSRFVKVTSSVLEHAPLVSDQRNVTLEPAGRPVIELLAEEGSSIIAPLSGPTKLHIPVAVAGVGAMPASVKVTASQSC